jgi:cytochrome c-type biogenesis protein CcmF
MNAVFGALLLYLALLTALYAAVASVVGARRGSTALIQSARNAAIAVWPVITLAVLVLILLLVRGDFNVAYAWSVTSLAMPTYLKVTALWGSQAGSLLFWSWLMSTFTAASMLRNWKRDRALMPYVIFASTATLAFFLMLVSVWENPFARYWQAGVGDVTKALFGPNPILYAVTSFFKTLGDKAPGLLGIIFSGMTPLSVPPSAVAFFPGDGQGLNPLLRHFGMIIHPPMLYLGFVSFVVPFSFGFAALVKGEVSDSWIRTTRRWTLVAWLFLSLGLILGGRWAYDVLGWGGFWGWDPVENAAFMPWLTGTAFLHSVMIQEKRGMLRRWNMVLIILTYLQVILGTFLTRSGVLSSVHAFAQSAIGPLFFLFVASALVFSVYLLITRWDQLKDEHQLESLLSRETLFVLNNVVFVAVNVAVAIGTFWPLVTELLADVTPTIEKSSVGPSYYTAVTGPLFLFMFILMGIAPLVSWHVASARRLGKAMIWPVLLTVVVIGLTAVLGVREPLALVGYAVVVLAGAVNFLEFHRGAIARVHAHAENYVRALVTLMSRNRRRYGGYVIHLGVVIVGLGIISFYSFQTQTQKTVSAGQTITLGDYVVEYKSLERYVATDGRQVARVNAVVYRDGQEVAQLAPRVDAYPDGERMTIPNTYTTLTGDDFYVLLVSWEQVDLSSATIKIYNNPLVNWVWSGGFIFILGTLIAAWPDYSDERREAFAPSRQAAQAAGK